MTQKQANRSKRARRLWLRGQLSKMIVAADLQRQGLGARLLDDFLVQADARGIHRKATISYSLVSVSMYSGRSNDLKRSSRAITSRRPRSLNRSR